MRLKKRQFRGFEKEKNEMLKLLNVLDAHNESIVSLKYAAANKLPFCGLLGDWESENELIDSILEYNEFYLKSDPDYEQIKAKISYPMMYRETANGLCVIKG